MSARGEQAGRAGLRLRVLGRLELRADEDPGDRDPGRVLAQPRRLALFLYLVLHRPGGFLGRDHLLGLFWPDAQAGPARASLRQALRFLRQGLGAETIVSRGDEVGVEPGSIRCDALEFRRALADGRMAEAAELYEGELLPGFFMPEAPEAQRWLETERSRLRDEAVRACLVRSDDAGADDPASAIHFARRALELDPTHEPAARQLIRVLDAGGNRAGAVAAYDAFADTLRDTLDLSPSPETEALIDRIRHEAASAPPEPAPAPVAPNRVVVLPFENLTGDAELDILGRMVVDWVSRGLSEVSELEIVPPAEGGAPDDRPGAGTLVEGSYYRGDDGLLLHARLTDVGRDRLLPGPEPISMPAEAPLVGLDELTDRIAAILAPALNPRATHVHRGARPPSFEVYRAYMGGLEAFIAGDWREAAERLRRCADAAPDYVLPRLVHAIASWNLGELEAAAEIAAEASRRRDTVGRFERAMIDMVLAWLKGNWAAAHESVLRQADLAPGSIASFQVAEEARRLNRLQEARDVLVQLDPGRGELRGWIHYWVELTTVLHLLGEHEGELQAAIEARNRHGDDPRARWLQITALAALGRLEDVEAQIEAVLALPLGRDAGPGRCLHETARELAAHGHDAAAARTLRRALDWFREQLDDDATLRARRDFGRALYDAEAWPVAEAIFGEIVETAPPGDIPSITGHHGHLRGHLDEGYLAAIARRRGDDAEASRWRRVIEEMDRRFLYGADRLSLAILDALEGDEAGAVSELRRALSEGLPFGLHLHADPGLAELRGNPRFDALMRPVDT